MRVKGPWTHFLLFLQKKYMGPDYHSKYIKFATQKKYEI